MADDEPVRWVGLVRNVMLGREGLHRETLLELLADAGGQDGRSHLTTGNVTFDAVPTDLAAIVERLEIGIAGVIGRPEPVITRSLEWFRDLAAHDPFVECDANDWELLVALLPETSTSFDPDALMDPVPSVIVEATTTTLLVARPKNVAGAPHANPLLEKASGAKATSRAWSTVLRLAADRG